MSSQIYPKKYSKFRNFLVHCICVVLSPPKNLPDGGLTEIKMLLGVNKYMNECMHGVLQNTDDFFSDFLYT